MLEFAAVVVVAVPSWPSGNRISCLPFLVVSSSFQFLALVILLLAPTFPLGSQLLLTRIFLLYSLKAMTLHHLARHLEASSSLSLQGSPLQFFLFSGL